MRNPTRFTNHMPAVLKAARLSRNLSQKTLAERMGVPRTYISKVENGNAMPTAESLTRYADGLKSRPYLLMLAAEMREQKERKGDGPDVVAELICFAGLHAEKSTEAIQA